LRWIGITEATYLLPELAAPVRGTRSTLQRERPRLL
jgi:hypothetical protein